MRRENSNWFFVFIFQDWRANKSNSKGRMIMLLFRIANFCSKRKIYFYVGLPYLVFYKLFVEWVLCIEIPWNTRIGKNLILYHGQALVINNEAIIGENCILRHSTTIGNRQLSGGGTSKSPIIRDFVDIGSNACIIGDITIMNYVKIGCGAVVTKNVSSYSSVIGNPAIEIKRESK